MQRQIPPQNEGLWFTTFNALINGGCPPELAKQAATIVATDDYSIDVQGGRSEADQALVKDCLKYLSKGVENE